MKQFKSTICKECAERLGERYVNFDNKLNILTTKSLDENGNEFFIDRKVVIADNTVIQKSYTSYIYVKTISEIKDEVKII